MTVLLESHERWLVAPILQPCHCAYVIHLTDKKCVIAEKCQTSNAGFGQMEKNLEKIKHGFFP